MAPEQDVEKMAELDEGTTASESTRDFDIETAEPKRGVEGAYGEPDADHEEVEDMYLGHLNNLEQGHVGYLAQGAEQLADSTVTGFNQGQRCSARGKGS